VTPRIKVLSLFICFQGLLQYRKLEPLAPYQSTNSLGDDPNIFTNTRRVIYATRINLLCPIQMQYEAHELRARYTFLR
jgi:hypothetical protein